MSNRARPRLTQLATAYSDASATLAESPPGDEAQQVSEQASEAEQPTPSGRWAGVIGMEAEITGDGRLIEPGALRWETGDLGALPLRFVREDVGAHDNAVVVGRILSVERRDGGVIWGEGDFDLGSEAGREAARQVAGGITTGVSMDLDDVSFEVRIARELFDEINAPMPVEIVEDGETADVEAPEPKETDAEGRVVVYKGDPDDELMVTTGARIRAATIVAIPAFAGARIAVTDEETTDDEQEVIEEAEAIVAAATPVAPPAAWFSDPGLTQPTPLTVTEDGRVYGHLATWDVCHIASPAGDGVCVTAPRSAKGYAYFHTGAIVTAEGSEIAVGHITMGTGHAKPNAGALAAASHYDNTGSTVVDARAGEDAFGVWIAGALRPKVTAEQRRELRSSPLSGDWRRIGGALELVAALAVNVPGFPVPRPSGLVASGELEVLVAAGMVSTWQAQYPGTLDEFSATDAAYLRRIVERERKAEREALAARVEVSRAKAAKSKVLAFASRRDKER